MSDTLVALLVTLAVIVGGNVLIVATRERFPGLADRVARYLPAMITAASSKDREAAIRRLIDEVVRLESTEAIPAQLAAKALAVTPKPPTASKLPPMPLLLVLALAMSLVGCTPAQRAQAKTSGVPIATVAGGVCEQVSGVMRDDVGGAFVEFACMVVRGAASVLNNLDSSNRVAVDRPDGPPVRVVVRVYLEGGKVEVQP